MLKNIDGQALICIGIAINAVYIACNHLIKKKPNWLMFLMGVAAGVAIVCLIVGLISLKH
jgi:hypothetical protein